MSITINAIKIEKATNGISPSHGKKKENKNNVAQSPIPANSLLPKNRSL
ncbi:hypothetical protein [Pedobacter steynii]